MLKGTKSIIAVIMAVCMLISISGCGNNASTNKGGETVVLKYVMAGPGMQEDSKLVWDEFNNKLKSYLPDVKIEFEVFSLSDYKQQFMLMQTSREKMDIVNTYGLTFSDEVKKGTFIELDSLLNQYGTDLNKELPEWLWNFSKVDGKIYSIPTYQMMCVMYGLKMFKDQSENYADVAALTNVIQENSTFGKEYYDLMEDYLKKLKDNGEIALGYQTGMFITKGFESILDYFVIRTDDENCKVEHFFKTEEAEMYFDRMADWYKKGYIRTDSLSANDGDKVTGKKTGFSVWTAQMGFKQAEQDLDNYGEDIINIPFDNNYYIPMNNAAGGTAIMANSANSEAAMKFLNLLQSEKGKELYNMLVFGMEGTHYTKTADDKILTQYNGQPKSSDRYGLYKWIVGNTEIAYDTQSDLEGYKEWIFQDINTSDNRSKLIGFVVDTSNISSKLAQVSAVKDEFRASLASGSLPNHREVYAQFVDKLEKAGALDIIDELQKQVDEFLRK